MNNNEWIPYDIPFEMTIEEMLELISDAESHSFEFKVENHTLYYREIVG